MRVQQACMSFMGGKTLGVEWRGSQLTWGIDRSVAKSVKLQNCKMQDFVQFYLFFNAVWVCLQFAPHLWPPEFLVFFILLKALNWPLTASSSPLLGSLQTCMCQSKISFLPTLMTSCHQPCLYVLQGEQKTKYLIDPKLLKSYLS